MNTPKSNIVKKGGKKKAGVSFWNVVFYFIEIYHDLKI